MYGDQFGEFVRGHWGLEGVNAGEGFIRTGSPYLKLHVEWQHLAICFCFRFFNSSITLAQPIHDLARVFLISNSSYNFFE